MLRIRRLLVLAWALLALSAGPLAAPLTARGQEAFLPTLARDPITWGTFLDCLEVMERWVGPRAPDWAFHTTPLGYAARTPLYLGDGSRRMDPGGRPVNGSTGLSGRVFFPPAWRVGESARMPILIYSHGTALKKDGVASAFMGHEWMFGAAAAAYYGFAVAMPDQPGMGSDAAAYHPFCQAQSLAYAVVDAIPAVRALFDRDPYLLEHGYGWDGRVFLLGYSEGGYATLAASREMETHRDDYGGEAGFILAGSACMAGPFDLSGTTRRSVLDPAWALPHPFFIPYVIRAYQGIYGDLVDPREALAPALLASGEDGDILEWTGGLKEGVDVDQLIAARLGLAPGQVAARALLNPEWVRRELEVPAFPGSAIGRILAENDLLGGWLPTRPMLFCQSLQDRDVPIQNTLGALGALGQGLREAGRDPAATLVFEALPEGLDHVTGLFRALPLGLDWIYRGAPAGLIGARPEDPPMD